MPDKKITDLVDGDPLQPTDEFVVARAGDNFKIDGSAVVAAVTKHDVTLDGNTAGALALVSSGTMTLAGGNNITLSQAGNAVTISAASIQADTQTAISGISASDTLYTSGTVRFTGVGGGVTVSSNTGQRVDISVAAQSVQPETQTFIGGISASDTLYTSGSVRFTGSNAVTVRSGTGQLVVIDAPTQTTQVETQTFIGGLVGSNATYTSGTVTITGVGGGITVSSNTGQRIDLSVAAQSTQTQGILSVGVSTGGNTVGNTQVSTGSRFVLVASGNATASQATAAGASTVTISVGTQTVQTQGILSAGVSTGGNTAGNTQVSTGSRLVIVGSNGITASQGTAAGATTITLSGVTTAAQTNQTGNVYASSNTFGTSSGTYDARTVSIAGSGAVSVAASNSGWVISAPAQSTQTQGIIAAGVSTGGNSSGDTGVASGTRLVFAGGNNITLSQGTAAGATTITISAPNLGAGAMSAGVSNLGNTAGSTGVTGTRLVLVGTNNISLSQSTDANGGTVSINSPLQTAAYWENMAQMQGVLYTNIGGVSKTPFYWPENLPQGINPANIAMRFSMVTANSDLSVSIHFGIYTFVNSTSAALLGSASDAFHVSSASSVSFSGQRNFVLTSPGTVAAISSLSAGNYLFGCMFSATATNAMNASVYAASAAAGPRLGRVMPGTNQLSTATSQGIAGLYGRGSTTVNAMPANVQASEVVNQGNAASSPMKPYIFIRS